MNKGTKSRQIDMLKGFHMILKRMITKGLKKPRLPNTILHPLILVSHITNKTNNLTTKIFNVSRIFEIILNIAEYKRKSLHEMIVELEYLLGI